MELSYSFHGAAKAFGLFVQVSIGIVELFTLIVMLFKSLNTSQKYLTAFNVDSFLLILPY